MACGLAARISAAASSFSEACNSPSAWITLARRSRSASACLAIARTIDSSMSTCLISTLDTLMPQASVWVSSSCWISWLRRSRSASMSSSSCLPSTARSVVCASWLVAFMKSSTCRIALAGSMTRKYTTALTLTETLSREITSWLGTSNTTVRRSTRTICWMPGMMITSPGPFTFQKRPSMNTTPRSYSRRMRMLATSSAMTRNTMVIPPNSNMVILLVRFHVEDQVVAGAHAHAAAALERHVAADPPPLAVDVRPALVFHVRQNFAGGADQVLGAGHHRPCARLDCHGGDEEAEQRARQRHRDDQCPREAVARKIGVDQHHRADDEGDDAAQSQRAEAGQESLGDHQGDAEDHQLQPGVADRHQLQREQSEQQADAADYAGQQHAGVGKFEDEAVDAEQHQDIGDGRMADDCQQAAAPVGLDALDAGAGGVEREGAVGHPDAAAVRLPQQVVEVGRDEVDHLQFQRLGRRQAHRLAHRPLGPVGIAPAQLGQPADVGDGIVHRLAHLGIARRGIGGPGA